jgi:predicted HicB family RNase H-like nuclease
MSRYLSYKGYEGTIEPQIEEGTLYGKLAFIRDLVTYEAKTLPALEKEFKRSVDEYLRDCAALKKTPDVPFKGSFNVRIGQELHRQAALALAGKSLNTFVCEAIKEKIERSAQQP